MSLFNPSTFAIDPEQILHLILEALDNIVEYDLAVILKLLNNNTLAVEQARGRLFFPELQDYQIDLKKREDIAEIIGKQKPVLFTSEDNHIDTYHDIIDLPFDHSCMFVPLHLQGKPLGVLTLDHLVCDMYSSSTLSFIDTVARLISIIVAQNRSSKELLSAQQRLTRERNLLLAAKSDHFQDVIGDSSAWQNVLDASRLVAVSDLSVLIQGETGTGKEQIARLIHRLSPRADKQFVALNCSVLNPQLAESELFGHEKGAFTSACSQRKGRFELADGGTLFLDEIGDLPSQLQPKLLRALQEKKFERVGGEKTIYSNVRVIAASHVNLEQAVKEKRFREDLYYRLNVFPILLPPLRERKDDVVLLAEYFLSLLRQQDYYADVHLSIKAVDSLQKYKWPGNVREVQNVIRRSALVAGGKCIEPEHLALKGSSFWKGSNTNPGEILYETENSEDKNYTDNLLPLDVVLSNHIRKALKLCNGKIYGENGAAALLGLKPTTLQSRMKKLGISRL
ncbi:MAG: AAA family ATPase [Deltaproteobacteria bacterium]|nr:MAG: AAA family ATPase [Deltaproteobacteria bacterium]